MRHGWQTFETLEEAHPFVRARAHLASARSPGTRVDGGRRRIRRLCLRRARGGSLGVRHLRHAHLATMSCSNELRSGVGTVFRFGMIGVRDQRITLALHGGRELKRIGPALTGELGGTYRFGDEAGFGLHLGLMPEYANFNASARAELFLDEYAAVGGMRYLPTYGESSTCFIGRPLR